MIKTDGTPTIAWAPIIDRDPGDENDRPLFECFCGERFADGIDAGWHEINTGHVVS